VLVGWVVVRRELVCPVVGSVVVAVDMRFLCGKSALNAMKKRVFVRTRWPDSQNVDDPAAKGYLPAP
jgi:hypothetical protein